MKAYNVVRYRAKPGREDELVEKNRAMESQKMKGFLAGTLIKTASVPSASSASGTASTPSSPPVRR